ncbi:RagB/SusD family nutrient uptake outer membrane protein [Bacteroides sp. 51]|uniref:RagB/SusD family nutrient uptake outer membrane protein n=1 Tax=Bacteroides sp. 51 TaxID=2302938 RepID=UPI0013D0974B|nr:RagB/SusD family nutrient uptake outer membrane protein [Bacteroides sp. 51]NDV82124.1 RagB/SusD family nutrient uptake outer membrane protein [Bacteroides sp. 51]
MKTIINKIKQAVWISACALATVTLSTSCNDYLDEPIYDSWGEDFFSSTERLNLGVRGVLESFSSQDTYGMSWMVFDCDTDISHIQGAGTGHVARDLGHYNIYTSHVWLENAWKLYYKAIDRANFILAKKDDVIVADTDKDRATYKQLIAEARVMRSLAYFDLIRLFGDVPYKDTYTVLDGEDMKYPRTDSQEIYGHICEEMEEAVPDLLWHDEFPGGYVGRFSKGAGHALLSRMYLFRAGWSLRQSGTMERPAEYMDYYRKASEHAGMVIQSGKHALNAKYDAVFKNMCEYKLEPQENLYEFQFYSATAQKGGSSQVGTYNGVLIAQGSSFGRANSYIKTHHFFYDTFEDTDLRKDVSVATWRINYTDGKDVYAPIARNQSYTWAPAKWRRDWHAGDAKDPNYTNVNWVFLRYSDVLLMKAEAENEVNNGPTESAVDCLNQVRRRAYGYDPNIPNATLDYTVSDFDKDTFFKEIVAERARELCFEGHRRMDLIRWNMLGDAITNTKKQFDAAIAAGELRQYSFDAGIRFTPNKHELYPVPSREILETGNFWKQNPGYTN